MKNSIGINANHSTSVSRKTPLRNWPINVPTFYLGIQSILLSISKCKSIPTVYITSVIVFIVQTVPLSQDRVWRALTVTEFHFGSSMYKVFYGKDSVDLALCNKIPCRAGCKLFVSYIPQTQLVVQQITKVLLYFCESSKIIRCLIMIGKCNKQHFYGDLWR